MNAVKRMQWGDVDGLNLGFAPIGRPIMGVYLYHVDGVLIDTAQSNMRPAVMQYVAEIRPSRVLLTHHHEDHSGNAAAVKAYCGADILGHPRTREKMKHIGPILPYQHLIWGRSAAVQVNPLPPLIETDRYRLLPLHTPGHAKDHTVYLEQQQGWLFSGDLYLGDRIKFFRQDENIRQQIASLHKLLAYDFQAIFCSHNPVLHDGKNHIRLKLNYLEEVFGTVKQLIRSGYTETEVISRTHHGKDRMVKLLTMGNASFANMIRSAFREAQRHSIVKEKNCGASAQE